MRTLLDLYAILKVNRKVGIPVVLRWDSCGTQMGFLWYSVEILVLNRPFPNYAPLLTSKTFKSRLSANFSYICCTFSTWPRLDVSVCWQWSVIRKLLIEISVSLSWGSCVTQLEFLCYSVGFLWCSRVTFSGTHFRRTTAFSVPSWIIYLVPMHKWQPRTS